MPEAVAPRDPDDARIDLLRARLADGRIDALLVSRPQNVRYLSGFTGSSAALLVSQAEALLVTDSRYTIQAQAECPGFEVLVEPGAPLPAAARRAGGGRIGFEAEGVTYAQWESLRELIPERAGRALTACRGLIEPMRAVKSRQEIDLIETAGGITARAFEQVLPLVRPGAVERDLALEIELRMKQAGAEEVAFDLIVASGPRGALPHGRASDRPLAAREFVVFDIGARFRGYHSDMTRTVFTGRPDASQREWYETVLRAQQRAIEAVKDSAPAREVDRAARETIEQSGRGPGFAHGTGHGVGLEIHEAPRIGPRSDETLAAGMVVTIEPGIYLPGRGGVRIEDMVLVTPEGCRSLTPTPKDRWTLE